MLLFQRIEEFSYQYTDSRRIIGEFMLSHKGELERLTMQEIADRTFTSKASLVRFAQALGFSGWKELLKEFLAESHYDAAHYTDIDPNFPFSHTSSTRDIVYQICNLQVESLLDTADLIDFHQLDKAVSYLKTCDKIAVFGQAPNSYVARLFQRKMLTIGRCVLQPDETNGMLAHSLNASDCAIIISYSGSGENRSPLNLLPILKARKVPVIGITGQGDNLLRRSSNAVLTISTRERLYSKIANYATEESIGYLLNVLFSCCFQEHYHENLAYKIGVSQRIEQRTSIYADMREEETP